MSSKIEVPQSEWIVASNPSTPVVERQQCCTPTPEEKKLLAAGDYTPEELWGGNRPTCPKCINAAPPELAELQATIVRLTAENERIKKIADNYYALGVDANLEIERLKGEPGEPVALQHVAVSEGGKLRWMTGRKMQECELYAMPYGSAINFPVYTSQPAPVSVVLPTLISSEEGPHYSDNRASELGYLAGYNACLDKVKELNQ